MPPSTTLSSDVLLLRLQAVAEETRFAILRLLGKGERCVCELQHELGAAQSRLSFHLRKLKEAGLVDDRRDGRWIYYRVVPERVEELQEALGALARAEYTGWPEGDGGCCG